jgi:GMP reductase
MDLNPDYFMVSSGIKDSDFENLCNIVDNIETKFICIDVANGYMEKLVDFCSRIRAKYPNHILVAGNVVSREITEELIMRGKVDIVKVGIGSGASCTTRLKTGVGMPQLSAVIECSDAAHGVGGLIISDGGVTCPGDMAKSFGGGSDFVMMGGQFAGHDENPGDIIERDDKFYKVFYGMSSKKAMEKHYGKMENYRSSEGRQLEIPYKGSINETIKDYLGGLRSTCTYINAKCIKHIPKCTTFLLVNNQLNRFFVK